MASETDGDDPDYDLTREEKDDLEKSLRERAMEYLRMKKMRERQRVSPVRWNSLAENPVVHIRGVTDARYADHSE